MSNPVIATLKYFGLPVTREEYIKLATLGATDAVTDLDPESEAEIEAAFEAERESLRELKRMAGL